MSFILLSKKKKLVIFRHISSATNDISGNTIYTILGVNN